MRVARITSLIACQNTVDVAFYSRAVCNAYVGELGSKILFV